MSAPLCACGRPSPDARLCRACTQQLAASLAFAAAIAPDLDDAVAKLLRRGSGAGKRSGDEQPLPLDLAASGAAHVLRGTLVGWVRIIKPLVPDRHGPVCGACTHRSCRAIRRAAWPADTVPSMASWLSGQLAVIRQHQAAADAHSSITRAVFRVVMVIDVPPERFGAGRCECGGQLWSYDDETAKCSRCGSEVYGVSQRRIAAAAKADALMTPRELSGALARLGYRVAESTISAWGTRGRLVKRPGGLYLLSDVLALCAARDARG